MVPLEDDGAVVVTFNVIDGNYTHSITMPSLATIGNAKDALHADLRLVRDFLVLRVAGKSCSHVCWRLHAEFVA